jgi:hypothetical protein
MFQEEFPVHLDLNCTYTNVSRPHWDCDEAGEGVHPDGPHSVGISISYGKYLPVAVRRSIKYAAPIVVDDYACREAR